MAREFLSVIQCEIKTPMKEVVFCNATKFILQFYPRNILILKCKCNVLEVWSTQIGQYSVGNWVKTQIRIFK